MAGPISSQNGTGPQEESVPLDALTSIHGRIHWPDTSDARNDENELDRIAIDNFLDTLADVALSVARRRMERDAEAGDVAA